MIKIIKIITIILSILIITSCDNPVGPSNENEENDIYELVLRDKFNNNGSGYFNYGDYIDTTISVYFVGLYYDLNENLMFVGEPQDPNDELLNKLNGFSKKVKKISDHKMNKYDIVDKVTGELGVIFRATKIEWISKTEAKVFCGYYSGFAASDCYLYYIKKINGNWYISYKVYQWQS